MIKLIILSLSFLILYFVYTRIFFRFIANKSKEIYNIRWAHRGFHFSFPENTIGAYNEMIIKEKNWGIELDIRMLRDGNIVCFHDFFTKRLLGVPGKITSLSYKDLKRYNVLNSEEKVPLFEDALKIFTGEILILVEVKGYLNEVFRKKLMITVNEYEIRNNTKVYFHAKNIFTYFKLAYIFPYRTFWVCNIFRKRFDFVKGKHYKYEAEKLERIMNDTEYMKTNNLEIPTAEDLSKLLVDEIEGNEPIQHICSVLSGIINSFTSRVGKYHWIKNSLILHRGILTNQYKEHSVEGIMASIMFSRIYQINVTLEIDVIMYNSEAICYHSDTGSDFLGQEKSCAEKAEIDSALTFNQLIKILKPFEKDVNLIIDIKDMKFDDRSLEKRIIEVLKKYDYKGNYAAQCFFPPVLIWLKENHPEIIRGQVYNSLKKFKDVKFVRKIVHLALSNKSNADYCVYDNDQYIWAFMKYNEIMGRPILVYAFHSEDEYLKFIGNNLEISIIVENVATKDLLINTKDWSEEFILKYSSKPKEKKTIVDYDD